MWQSAINRSYGEIELGDCGVEILYYYFIVDNLPTQSRCNALIFSMFLEVRVITLAYRYF